MKASTEANGVARTPKAVARAACPGVLPGFNPTFGFESVPLDESHRQVPINPYGRTKYIFEQALDEVSRTSITPAAAS